jgi:hypothetical protein
VTGLAVFGFLLTFAGLLGALVLGAFLAERLSIAGRLVDQLVSRGPLTVVGVLVVIAAPMIVVTLVMVGTAILSIPAGAGR